MRTQEDKLDELYRVKKVLDYFKVPTPRMKLASNILIYMIDSVKKGHTVYIPSTAGEVLDCASEYTAYRSKYMGDPYKLV